MKLTCNIDQRGRRIRLWMGIGLMAIAVVLYVLWARNGGVVAWIVTVCVLVSGLFGLFEARKGWCAMRAMGVKTKW